MTGHDSPGGRSWSIPAHRALVDALAAPLPAVYSPLLGTDGVDGCLGAVLAGPVVAHLSVPPFTNSAMDGFAVRHADIAEATHDHPMRLPVAGDIPAGDTIHHELQAGTAWRIMTGAPIPAGADTVVRVEQTDHSPGIRDAPTQVAVLSVPAKGSNIRDAGEGTPTGATVLPEGCVLDAAALASAAAAGHDRLPVHPRPRIGLVTTGDELVAPGIAPHEGQVPDSNAVLLTGLAEQSGARVVARARINDNPRALHAILGSWPSIDLLITAGGISAGAYEVVRLAFAGAGVRFHRVAQQPGGRAWARHASVDARCPCCASPGTR